MYWRLTVSLGLFSTVSHGLMGSWTAATCWCCQVKWLNTLTSSSGFFMPSHCPSAQSDRPAAGTCLITCWPEQNPLKNILWKATWEQNLPDCLALQRNCWKKQIRLNILLQESFVTWGIPACVKRSRSAIRWLQWSRKVHQLKLAHGKRWQLWPNVMQPLRPALPQQTLVLRLLSRPEWQALRHQFCWRLQWHRQRKRRAQKHPSFPGSCQEKSIFCLERLYPVLACDHCLHHRPSALLQALQAQYPPSAPLTIPVVTGHSISRNCTKKGSSTTPRSGRSWATWWRSCRGGAVSLPATCHSTLAGAASSSGGTSAPACAASATPRSFPWTNDSCLTHSTQTSASSCCHFVPKDSSPSVQHFYFFNMHVHHSPALCFILCSVSDEKEELCSNYLQVALVCISGDDHFNSGCLTSKVN